MKLEDFMKEFKNGCKTVDVKVLIKTLTEVNCDAVESLLNLVGDKDFLVDICMSYAILFCILEDNLHFNFMSCVTEMYMRAQHPELLAEIDKMLKEERDDDFERSWGPQKDDDTNVQ